MRYGTFRYRTFSQIMPSKEDFLSLWNESAYPKVLEESGNEYGADMTTIYYMLLSRYAHSPIASLDETQFVNKMFLLIFQHGKTLARKLEVQAKLKALTEEQLVKGGKAFYNHAMNPSTAPVTDTIEALGKIDSQNVTSYVKSVMEGYEQLLALIDDSVVDEFLSRFEVLFNPLVMPDYDLHYIVEEDE